MPDPKQPNPIRIPPAILGVGVLVIALGFGIPLLTSRAVPDAPLPTPQGAAEFAPRANAPAPIAAPNLGLSLLRLVAAFAVVCAVCVIAARWVGRKGPAPAETAMQVIASLTVGRCAVHLVRAGDRRMLIGTDATGVKALVELTGPEPEPAPVTDTTSPASSPG